MPKISGGAINLIVTDPPLPSTLKHNGGRYFLGFEVVFLTIFPLHKNVTVQMKKIMQKRVKTTKR
jgi:hypothetical protein